MDPRGVPNFPYEKPRGGPIWGFPKKRCLKVAIIWEDWRTKTSTWKNHPRIFTPGKKNNSHKSTGSVTGISLVLVAGSAQQPIDTSAFAGNLRGTEASLQPRLSCSKKGPKNLHPRKMNGWFTWEYGPPLEEEKFHHLKQNYQSSGLKLFIFLGVLVGIMEQQFQGGACKFQQERSQLDDKHDKQISGQFITTSAEVTPNGG